MTPTQEKQIEDLLKTKTFTVDHQAVLRMRLALHFSKGNKNMISDLDDSEAQALIGHLEQFLQITKQQKQGKMKKNLATKILKRIKTMQARLSKLRELGVDLIEYETGVSLLEESVVLLLVKDENKFDKALVDVQWWLYENVDKVIILGDDSKIDVTTPENFLDWFEKWYDVD